MVFPTYTVGVFRGTVAAGSSQSSASPPAGYQWILRDVLFTNVGAAEAVPAVLLPGFYLVVAKVAPLTTYHLELRQVVQAGEAVTITTSAEAIYCAIVAYEVSAPPPRVGTLPA